MTYSQYPPRNIKLLGWMNVFNENCYFKKTRLTNTFAVVIAKM